MVFHSGRDLSTRPQANIIHQHGQNENSSLESSRLASLRPDLEDKGEESQRSSATMNPDPLAKKVSRSFFLNDKNPSVGSNGTAGSASLLPGPKSSVSQGILKSHTGIIGSRGKKAVLCSPVIQRDTENGFSSPGDGSDVRPNTGSWLSSARSGTSSSRIVDQLRDDNPGESLQEIRKHLASLEKEKELISLTRKLNKRKRKKQQDSH